MPIWAAGITAGAGLLGGSMSRSGASSANSQNRKMAMMQMAFQKDMATRAHQYEVKDLRKAGLNPILSGTGGAGSATPSGSTAKMENVGAAGVSSALDALTTISQALLTKQQADKTKAETENTQARTTTEAENPALVRGQSALVREQASTAKATQANIAADTKIKEIGQHVSMSEINKNNELTRLFQKQGFNQDIQSKLLGLNVEQAAETLKSLRLQGELDDSAYGEALRYIDRGLDTAGRILDLTGKGRGGSGRSPRDYPSYKRN